MSEKLHFQSLVPWGNCRFPYELRLRFHISPNFIDKIHVSGTEESICVVTQDLQKFLISESSLTLSPVLSHNVSPPVVLYYLKVEGHIFLD